MKTYLGLFQGYMFDVSCEVCVNIEVKTKVAGLQLNKSSFFLGGGVK